MAAPAAGSKILDVLHKTLVTGVVLGTCVIGADLVNRYYVVRQRRIEWEKQNPEYVAEFYAKQKDQKLVDQQTRADEKRKKTEELFAVMRARGELDDQSPTDLSSTIQSDSKDSQS